MPPDLAERKLNAIKAAIATGQSQCYEQTFNIGSNVHFEEVRIIKINDDSVLCLSRDIKERRESEMAIRSSKELAESANRAKSDFLANMSHEIRTPMNGVLGMAQLLAATPLREDQRNFVQVILDSGDILMMIINDILDFSKIESGKLQLEQKEFNAVNAINSVCKLLSKQAFDKGINLQCHINNSGDLYYIGDQGRLKQVLINLIGNAIKFTEHGNVTISYRSYPLLQSEQDIYQFEFTIADTGIGIDSDRINTLFEPFTQADASISRQYGGTGLGLAISKRFVELMGGHIWVESRGNIGGNPPPHWQPNHSTADQQGANFYFTVQLPLAKSQTLAIAQPSSDILEINGQDFPLKILLVEDNMFNQKIVQIMFQRMGYAIDIANNGEECLPLIFGQDESPQPVNYDLVLMDVQMPVMDGLTATRLIRQRSGSAVRPWIIALTADVMPDDCENCLRAGMNDYISKPIDIKAIKQSLQRFTLT